MADDTSASGPDAVARATKLAKLIVNQMHYGPSDTLKQTLVRDITREAATAITQAVSEEREACAKIADRESEQLSGNDMDDRGEARYIASLIRSRGKPDERGG